MTSNKKPAKNSRKKISKKKENKQKDVTGKTKTII